jgi:hypothetical protein
MTEECTDLEREAARASDRYYRAITDWLTDRRRSIELREKASVLASVYSRSLDVLLRCLARVRGSHNMERKIERTQEFKSLVEKDMEFLNPATGSLKTAPDET